MKRHPGYIIGNHWLEAAYERICTGEEIDAVLAEYGYVRMEFVNAATELEREACAKVCDDEAANRHIDRMTVPWNATELNEVFRVQSNQAHECAVAIRARGQE